MYQLSPSILAADYDRLAEQVAQVEKCGVKWLHLDIMDGQFVPATSFGVDTIRKLRPNSKLFFDVHLMVVNPEEDIARFAAAGADMIVVHVEACKDVVATIAQIKAAGCKAGVSLKPNTSIDCLDDILDKLDMVLIMTVEPGYGGQEYIKSSTDKIRALKKMIDERGRNDQGRSLLNIEVDGGIYKDNIDEVLEAGANIIVAGSAVFHGDIEDNIRGFQEAFARHE